MPYPARAYSRTLYLGVFRQPQLLFIGGRYGQRRSYNVVPTQE